MAWFMDKPLLHLGVLTLMFSTVAMLWNMLFNYLFDRAQSRLGFERGLWARVSHALLFEVGLIVVLVPLAAWWLSIGLLEALLLDIVLILFFCPTPWRSTGSMTCCVRVGWPNVRRSWTMRSVEGLDWLAAAPKLPPFPYQLRAP